MINENIKRAKKLIKEGKSNIQDKLIEAMLDIKKSNPELSQIEVMQIFKDEIKKFLKFHEEYKQLPLSELPKKNPNTRTLKDKIPYIKMPYGSRDKNL